MKKTSPWLPRESRHADPENVRFLRLEGTPANPVVCPFARPFGGSLGGFGK
jgi:hypothetical protein